MDSGWPLAAGMTSRWEDTKPKLATPKRKKPGPPTRPFSQAPPPMNSCRPSRGGLLDDDLRADFDAAVEVDDVLVDQANAA